MTKPIKHIRDVQLKIILLEERLHKFYSAETTNHVNPIDLG